MIIHGDCLRELKNLPDNSVDSIVTDPPYGLSFMGKKWDYDVPSVEIWRECLRVLKPGGHLLSFAGTRTYHRMACNIEDAGFEIRDQIMWLYGSGFPKSHDISKAIDKAAGAEREVIGVNPSSRPNQSRHQINSVNPHSKDELHITNPATESAKQWQGWGTALKPANEPIVVARKPLEAGLTVAANVLKYGTGALNIDASRVGDSRPATVNDPNKFKKFKEQDGVERAPSCVPDLNTNQGRWPANVLLDEEAAKALDEQSGIVKSAGEYKGDKNSGPGCFGGGKTKSKNAYANEKGGASRFFYVAKASKRERGEGNVHPTVKPIKLMEYLIKLVTPKLGKVLDPFAGSGTTLLAAVKLNFQFIGIERESEYVQIIRARVKQAQLEKGA